MNELSFVFYIEGSPGRVWEALVSPEGTRKTVFGSVIRSSFQVGEKLEYVGPGNDGNETVHVYGTLLAFDPNQKFSYTEHAGPSYRPDHADWESRVTISLEPFAGTTKLTLVNDQWTDNHPSYEHTQGAWPVILSNIKTYVETGRTLDYGF